LIATLIDFAIYVICSCCGAFLGLLRKVWQTYFCNCQLACSRHFITFSPF